MSRGRRGVLLAMLSVVLGSLAASDMARREAALDRRLAPLVDVVVARDDLEEGRVLTGGDLRVRRVPVRYAPLATAAAPAEVVGRELAVAVPAGADVGAGQLRDDASAGAAVIGRGERAAEVTGTGSAELIVPGALVDVLVVPDTADGSPGRARVALSGAEVLAVREAAAGGMGEEAVTATLRVTVAEAVALAAAESRARAVRLLARSG